MEDKTEQIIKLLFQGRAIDEIATELKVHQIDLSRWIVGSEFLAEARREFAKQCLELMPYIEMRLEEIITEGSETQSMSAIKVVLKMLEDAGDFDTEREKARDILRTVVDKIIEETQKKQNEIDKIAKEGENER